MRAVVVFGSAAALLLLLYLLDFSYWKGPFGVLLRRVGVLAIVILVAIGSLLLIDDFPVLPLSVAMLLLPFAALFLRTTLYASNNASDVSCVMGINFVTSALIVLIIWMCWLFGAWTTVNNHWFENRAYFIEAARCYHSEWANETMTTVSDGSTVCLAAFLLWASPLMLFAICIFLGLFLILLSRCVCAEHHVQTIMCRAMCRASHQHHITHVSCAGAPPVCAPLVVLCPHHHPVPLWRLRALPCSAVHCRALMMTATGRSRMRTPRPPVTRSSSSR